MLDEKTRLFYYINTKSGEIFHRQPVCLGTKDDLPVETYRHRNAVCRIINPYNLSASGVLVSYRGLRLILTDATTLPNEEIAPKKRVVILSIVDLSLL